MEIKINRRITGARRRGAAFLLGLMVFTLCCTALPSAAKADQATIDAELIARMRNVVANLAPTDGTQWQKYLNERFYKATKLNAAGATLRWNTASGVPDTWKWSGATATGTQATSTEKPGSPASIPYYDSTNQTYYIWSGEQLRYALNECSGQQSLNRIISIQADIDLNGQAGASRNWPCINELRDTFINGNGFTIYNLRVDDSKESRTDPNTSTNKYGAFIGWAQGLDMRHLTFSNVNICSDFNGGVSGQYEHSCGIIGFLSTTHIDRPPIIYKSNPSILVDVTVKNAFMVGGDQVGGLVGRTSKPNGVTPTIDLKNCYAENIVSFGRQHVSSLASSLVNFNTAEYCYSIGSVVISTAGHSGGLFSCGSGVNYLLNCFVDAEVYGNTETGVFAGSMSGLGTMDGTRFLSCYSSGFVEGQAKLGGFIGDMPAYSQAFYDCYSTALVGLRSNATDIGGFIGSKNSDGAIRAMRNCYAAGETGYTGLNCSATSTVPSNDRIGGMIGSIIGDRLSAMSYCYYDQQTTAMRDWGIGENNSNSFSPAGVMTTDSVQNGTGLTNTDPLGSTNGFKGLAFNTNDKYPAGAITGALWDYSAKGHYPELTVFKNATEADWGTPERADLVQAYSLSSTATVKLDTWDYALNKATGKIDVDRSMNALVYDTVRDLTSSFTLTTHLVDNWDRIGDQDSKTHGESTSVIAGETLDVLSLKAVGGQYLCDELVPGIEWLMVTCKVGDQTATRRLRVIPTASLDAGINAVITGLYDHADDVKLFYSTGARIEKDRRDVTTGIYPDEEEKSNAISVEQTKMLTNAKNTYSTALTQVGNDLFYGASASYMGKTGENAENSKVYVYIYKVNGIDETTNEIQTGQRITLTDTNISDGAKQFNGYSLLSNDDQRYLIEYMWELEDGRVLSDAKMVRRAKVPFNVTLRLYKNTLSAATLYPTGEYLYTGVNAPGGSRLPLTDFSSIAAVGRQAAEDVGQAEFKQTAQTAWKLKNPADQMIRLKLTMQNGVPAIRDGEVFSTTLENPAAGDHLTLPNVRYRIVYKSGAFFTIPENVTRTYVLQYDTANTVWHLELDKFDEPSPEVREILFSDVENNVFVDVVVHAEEPPPTGSLTLRKTVTGELGEQTKLFSFAIAFEAAGRYPYTGSRTGTISSGETVQLMHGEFVTIAQLPAGIPYSITESDNEGYRVQASGDTGVIAAGRVATAAFINDKSAVPKPGEDAPVPKTGDNSPIATWGLLLLAGCIGVVTLAISVKKAKYKQP